MLVTNIKCDSTWHFWQYMTFDSMWHFWQYTTKESPCITSLNSLFSHSKTPSILSGIFFHMFLKRVLVPGEIMFIFWQSFVSPWEVGDWPWSEGHVQLMDRLRMSASQRGRGSTWMDAILMLVRVIAINLKGWGKGEWKHHGSRHGRKELRAVGFLGRHSSEIDQIIIATLVEMIVLIIFDSIKMYWPYKSPFPLAWNPFRPWTSAFRDNSNASTFKSLCYILL